MVHADGPVGLDAIAVNFDDERAVADAGIVLAASLAERLGIEALVDETVDLGERPGAANAGAKVMTLVSAMALGADCIDDCDLLRAGRTGQVLGHQVAAPSTLGTFLRAFTFGHVRQLDRVLADCPTSSALGGSRTRWTSSCSSTAGATGSMAGCMRQLPSPRQGPRRPTGPPRPLTPTHDAQA